MARLTLGMPAYFVWGEAWASVIAAAAFWALQKILVHDRGWEPLLQRVVPNQLLRSLVRDANCLELSKNVGFDRWRCGWRIRETLALCKRGLQDPFAASRDWTPTIFENNKPCCPYRSSQLPQPAPTFWLKQSQIDDQRILSCSDEPKWGNV